MEMHFVSLFFLNERTITTSLLMIHLKCTFVHYVNLNSSFINKPYFWAVEYAISGCFFFLFFFRFLIYIYFNEAFDKNSMGELSFFNANFQNSFQD